MSIKPKHYPHPVLESQFTEPDDDFFNSRFEASINYELNADKDSINFEVTFYLKNDTLVKMINNGKAIFALLIVCDSTFTRILEKITQFKKQLKLSARSLNKTVRIYPFILANKNIDNYINTDLIDPIRNLSFSVQRGDILAIAPYYEFYIEKEPVFEVGSIFEFILQNKKNHLLSFNANHSKIQIYMSSEMYEKVRELSQYPGINNILISMFYVPAVIHALKNVVSLDEDIQLQEYKDYNWYRTIEMKLRELKLGDELSEINEEDIINLVHHLMENPYEKALSSIEELLMGSGDG